MKKPSRVLAIQLVWFYRASRVIYCGDFVGYCMSACGAGQGNKPDEENEVLRFPVLDLFLPFDMRKSLSNRYAG
jgi:hypothetical protein